MSDSGRSTSSTFHTSLELLEQDVGEQYQHACGQQPNHTLVDGDDVLQGVDALLHGVGVDVVINGGPDAPHRPYSIHQRFHSGRDHWEGRLQLGSSRIRCLLAPLHYRERRGWHMVQRGGSSVWAYSQPPKQQPQLHIYNHEHNIWSWGAASVKRNKKNLRRVKPLIKSSHLYIFSSCEDIQEQNWAKLTLFVISVNV